MGSQEGGRTNRVVLSLLTLGISIGITIVCFLFGLPFFFLFLVVPFLFLRGRDRQVLTCPACGYEGEGAEQYCPYDGNHLVPDP